MTRREEILDILMVRTSSSRDAAEAIADAILALPPVETGELVTKETHLRLAALASQQEAEIARLQKAFEQERANNLRNAREATEWCDAAEKAEAERDHYLRKVEQFAASAPAGSGEWVMVPREPTEAMHLAGELVPSGIGGCPPSVANVYRAMIAAAPSAVEDGVNAEREPGMDWQLSDETQAAMREIDENIALAPSRIRARKP